MMLFHEIYGLYYQAVARMISEAIDGELTGAKMRRIAQETAFSESGMAIESALKSGRWPLIGRNGETPVVVPPSRGLTILERRWLKAISLDPRLRLFGDLTWEDDVDPLFRPEDIAIYDQFDDGDPYASPEYCANFRTILTAIRDRRSLDVEFYSARGIPKRLHCNPWRLEYSQKDDKFRLLTHGQGGSSKINLARIARVVLCGENSGPLLPPARYRREYILEIKDERNALERILLHFADLEKQTEHIGVNSYRMTVKYDAEDEAELVIRVLSFGPMLRAVAPESFVNQIRERLKKQMKIDSESSV